MPQVTEKRVAQQPNWMIVGIVVALLITTIGFFHTNVRYEKAAEHFLENSQFDKGRDSWQLIGSPENLIIGQNSIRLVKQSADREVGLYQARPVTASHDALIVRISVRTKVLSTAVSRPANFALVSVVCLNAKGLSLYLGRRYFFHIPLRSTQSWRTYQATVTIPNAATACQFGARIFKSATGYLEFRRLKIFPVIEKAFWRPAYYGLVLLLLAGAYVSARQIFASVSPGRRRWLLAISALILATAVLTPTPIGRILDHYVATQFGQFQGVWDDTIGSISISLGSWMIVSIGSLSKFGHVAAFFLVAIFMCRFWPRMSRWSLFLLASLLAASLETLQYFSTDRHPHISDASLDFLGLLIGFLVMAAVSSLRRIRHDRAS